MMLFDQYNVTILEPTTVLLDLDDGSFDAMHQAMNDDELCAVLELVTQTYLNHKAATRQLVAGVVNKDWRELECIAPLCGKVDSRRARRLLLEIAGEVRGATLESGERPA